MPSVVPGAARDPQCRPACATHAPDHDLDGAARARDRDLDGAGRARDHDLDLAVHARFTDAGTIRAYTIAGMPDTTSAITTSPAPARAHDLTDAVHARSTVGGVARTTRIAGPPRAITSAPAAGCASGLDSAWSLRAPTGHRPRERGACVP